jgi:hypothetical protein
MTLHPYRVPGEPPRTPFRGDVILAATFPELLGTWIWAALRIAVAVSRSERPSTDLMVAFMLVVLVLPLLIASGCETVRIGFRT